MNDEYLKRVKINDGGTAILLDIESDVGAVRATTLTPSDAVPPEEPALVTLEVPPDPVTAEDWREKYITAHAKWSEVIRTANEERDAARREVAQLTAMVRAMSQGGAGTSASVLLTSGAEGSLFVVIAPTLDEQTVADLLGRQIADASTAREQGAAEGYRRGISEASAAAFDADEVDTEHAPTLLGLVHEAMGEEWTHPEDLVDRMKARRESARAAERERFRQREVEYLKRQLTALEKP